MAKLPDAAHRHKMQPRRGKTAQQRRVVGVQTWVLRDEAVWGSSKQRFVGEKSHGECWTCHRVPVRAFLAALPVWETDPGGEPIRFLNHYDCPCGGGWSDAWSATCDDDCPSCGTTCSPTSSEDIEPEAKA